VEIETLAAAPDQWRSMGRWCSAIRSWAAFHLQGLRWRAARLAIEAYAWRRVGTAASYLL